MSNAARHRGLFSTEPKDEKKRIEAFQQFLYYCEDACTESLSPEGHPFKVQVGMSLMLVASNNNGRRQEGFAAPVYFF